VGDPVMGIEAGKSLPDNEYPPFYTYRRQAQYRATMVQRLIEAGHDSVDVSGSLSSSALSSTDSGIILYLITGYGSRVLAGMGSIPDSLYSPVNETELMKTVRQDPANHQPIRLFQTRRRHPSARKA
jgi:hypothetical protein